MPRIRIAIDADLFNAVSDEEKAKISSILKDTNLLTQDGTFEGEGTGVINAQAAIADPQSLIGDFKKKFNLCKIGCDVAASAAAAACTASTSGIGLAVCLAAADIAREACRDAC